MRKWFSGESVGTGMDALPGRMVRPSRRHSTLTGVHRVGRPWGPWPLWTATIG